MSRNSHPSVRTLSRLGHMGLAALALLLMVSINVSPGLAAGTIGTIGTTGTTSPPSQSPQSSQSSQLPSATCPPGGQCFADVPSTNPFYPFINRIYQQDLVSGYPCGGTGEPCDAEHRPYYRPVNNVTRQQMAKFIDNARRLPQIHIQTAIPDAAIWVSNTLGNAIYAETYTSTALFGRADLDGAGVYGQSNSGDGVDGISTSSAGVYGESTNYVGVYGIGYSWQGVLGISSSNSGVYGGSSSGAGVYGASSTGYGVYGTSDSSWAGYFAGSINVTGGCTGCLGSSKVDDPIDPANKYLYHSAVQSPDMMDIYNGNVTTDANGQVVVTMPPYFEALNRDFRYQLTVMGQFAQAIVSEKMKDNHFVIKTDKPKVEVSWQVTGIRQDGYSNAHRTPVEEDKPRSEQGKYLHPTELGQPTSLGVDYEQQQAMAAESKP